MSLEKRDTLSRMALWTHHVVQHRSPVTGVELMTISSNHQFPRHAHDQFGIGVIQRGVQRSWSGIGQVEAVAGDVIMVNPGEIHDGIPIARRIREWRMIYFDPKRLAKELEGETTCCFEVARPVAQDQLLARHFEPLFEALIDLNVDHLAREENLLESLMYALRQYGAHRSSDRQKPCVARALKRIDRAPEMPVSLSELAALSDLSRFQLLRAFTAAVGITPHAYVIQRRARLAKRFLAKGFSPAHAAAQSGFADQSHMTRAVVRQFGITPRRYQAAVI